ncbi:TetR/AcrR family transcriptional regulator [Cellulomonas sp. P22]|uniref:TetR/AcrR family transcriptional regulator n=1 Tax=Cellulomonas sp. P22 TaxID=3373189 RepID=UPI0037AED51B
MSGGAGTTTAKGERRRAELARAAAAIVREEGPGALTHRAVAARAGASLSATTYYFTGLDDLLAAAGEALVATWVEHARTVAAQVAARATPATQPARERAAHLLVSAVLPPGDDDAVRAHYEHLLGAGRVPALARAIAAGRHDLDAVVAEVVRLVGADVSPALVVAVVDGAVVTALTEQRPVRASAAALLAQVLPGGS